MKKNLQQKTSSENAHLFAICTEQPKGLLFGKAIAGFCIHRAVCSRKSVVRMPTCVHSLALSAALTHRACCHKVVPCCYHVVTLLHLPASVCNEAPQGALQLCAYFFTALIFTVPIRITRCCRRVRVRKQHTLLMVQQPPVQPLQPPTHPFPWVGLRLWIPLTTIPTGQLVTHCTPHTLLSMSLHDVVTTGFRALAVLTSTSSICSVSTALVDRSPLHQPRHGWCLWVSAHVCPTLQSIS